MAAVGDIGRSVTTPIMYISNRANITNPMEVAYTGGWQDYQWQDKGPWTSGRPKSPRRRTQSPRQRTTKQTAQHFKGEEQKGKGKGHNKDSKGFAGPPSTQWLTPPSLPASMAPPYLDAAPLSVPSASAMMPSMQPFPKPSGHKDDQELHSLRHMYKEIKNKPNLPEDIKKVVMATEATVRKVDAKTHSQLVSQLNNTRKKLSEIDEQWEAYRQQWADYLDKATQMWMSHVEEFEQGELRFAERRGEALRNLQTTREALHDAHQRTMGQDVLESTEIETAQEALDATMTVDENDAAGVQTSFAQIKENLNGVVQQVRSTIEEKIKKRERLQVTSKDRRGSHGYPRSRDCGTGRQEGAGFHLAPCLQASFDEVSPECTTSGRRDKGRKKDRFCKVSFWPTIDFEGEVNVDSIEYCNFWSSSDDLHCERIQYPFPFHHSVLEEPDFHSVWEARDSALLLQEALQSTAI